MRRFALVVLLAAMVAAGGCSLFLSTAERNVLTEHAQVLKAAMSQYDAGTMSAGGLLNVFRNEQAVAECIRAWALGQVPLEEAKP